MLFVRLMLEALYFFAIAPMDVRSGAAREIGSLGDYLSERRYSTAFRERLLLPMLSVVCTCSYKGVEGCAIPHPPRSSRTRRVVSIGAPLRPRVTRPPRAAARRDVAGTRLTSPSNTLRRDTDSWASEGRTAA